MNPRFASLTHRRLPLLLGLCLAAGPGRGAVISLSIEAVPGGVRVSAPADSATYFILQQSDSLGPFSPLSMSLADAGAQWDMPTAGNSRRFWNVRQVSVWAPEDSDRDGIDDIYEIRHPVLNPLNPADASLTVPGFAFSYLEEYRTLHGLGSASPEVYSREVSFFNGEGGPAQGGIPEVYSREVSFFNGEGGPAQGGIPEVYSREVSFFNGEGGPAQGGIPEVYSREVSFFNGEGGPAQGGIPEVYSREVSFLNDIP